MAFVYPAHLVIDHSGLFDHHSHAHHDHSEDQPYDDELCPLCLSLSSIEVSESVQLVHIVADEPFFQNILFSECRNSLNLSDARAPPAGLLI